MTTVNMVSIMLNQFNVLFHQQFVHVLVIFPHTVAFDFDAQN